MPQSRTPAAAGLAVEPEPSAAAIRPNSLRHQIAAALTRDIITGVYKPGDRLVERALVKRFGVSAIPIREALQDLENQGLASKRINAGCSVVSLSPEDIESITRFRQIVEPRVIEWAASRMTPQAKELLANRLASLKDAAEANDMPRFFLADLEFHEAIWTVAGNRWAARALSTSIGSLFASGLMAAQKSNAINIRDEAAKHEAMFNCLVNGDGVGAASLLSRIAHSFESRVVVALNGPPAAPASRR